MEILYTTLLFLLALCVLVTIHELGHFWAAKAFKIRVETFSIFFPPKIVSFKRGETTYQIGSIPLGGYVKISGMIDESMDKEHLAAPMQPWEFRAKPVWQRFIVMIAGIVMNVFLAITVFSILKFAFGEPYVPISELDRLGIYAQEGSPGYQLGFRSGDKFVSLKGEKPLSVTDAAGFGVLLGSDVYYEVERAGETVKIEVANNLLDSIKIWRKDKKYAGLFDIALPNTVNLWTQESLDALKGAKMIGKKVELTDLPGIKAGIQAGDRIMKIDGQRIAYFPDVSARIGEIQKKMKKEELEAYSFPVEISRPGVDSILVTEVSLMDSLSYLGVIALEEINIDTIQYSFPGAIWGGIKQSFGIVGQQIQGYGKMASGDASVSNNLQGPLGIAVAFYASFKAGGWASFWNMTAFLSMILAFVNFLPIPALDGGHLAFLTWEAITGREPSDKVKIIAQWVGMIFILLLMVAVFWFDIASFFKD